MTKITIINGGTKAHSAELPVADGFKYIQKHNSIRTQNKINAAVTNNKCINASVFAVNVAEDVIARFKDPSGQTSGVITLQVCQSV